MCISGSTSDRSDQTLIAFSSVSTFQLRLPAGQKNTSMLQLSVTIRDQMDCVRQVNLPSVVVRIDSDEIDHFLLSLQSSIAVADTSVPSSTLNNNPLVQILSSGNQNAVGQVLSSLSQQFNEVNAQALQTAADSECLRM
jgi:hypothetical protein